MNSKFTTVLLDADETVLDFHIDERNALKNTLNELNLQWTEELNNVYLQENLRQWKAFEQGKVTRQQLWRLRFANFFERTGLTTNVDLDTVNNIYLNYLAQGGTLIPGACEFIKRLKKFAKIYITTNGLTVSQTGRMKNSGLDRLVDGVYISQDIGYSKPSKDYFDYIFNQLNIADRSRVIIVGDSLTSDMQGGKNAGIITCLYNPKGDVTNNPLCDFIIRNYDEFFSLVL